MADLSVIIPCYNEARNIPFLLGRISDLINNFPNLEIILVNNGSTDNTEEEFNKIKNPKPYNGIKTVLVPVNLGYGWGILSGLKEASGDFLGWTHADLQTDLHDLAAGFKRLMEYHEPELAIVKGRRKNRPFFDQVFSCGMQIISSLVLGAALCDINAQPKIFPRSLYLQMKNPPHDFSLDLYLLYLAKIKRYKILEIPVFFGKRRFGEAKGGGSIKTKIPLIKRTFSYIFRLAGELKNKGV
ncbi:MAG: hypothetical protein A2096_01080 [Spirochaetes bacterium GWF1_41_5]|nr:MAG: hypothetical protein A2096_01080 [Spirochaetes bacterium GWF1_41_5]HBE03157.1 glycosyl transferase family 2 [Spirochaetia bacterium]